MAGHIPTHDICVFVYITSLFAHIVKASVCAGCTLLPAFLALLIKDNREHMLSDTRAHGADWLRA